LCDQQNVSTRPGRDFRQRDRKSFETRQRRTYTFWIAISSRVLLAFLLGVSLECLLISISLGYILGFLALLLRNSGIIQTTAILRTTALSAIVRMATAPGRPATLGDASGAVGTANPGSAHPHPMVNRGVAIDQWKECLNISQQRV
jgi:hypothetical protein